MVVPFCHDPCATVTNQRSCLPIGWYRDLTHYKTQIVLLCHVASVGNRIYVSYFRSDGCLIDLFICQYNYHWSRTPRPIFRSDGNIPGYRDRSTTCLVKHRRRDFRQLQSRCARLSCPCKQNGVWFRRLVRLRGLQYATVTISSSS